MAKIAFKDWNPTDESLLRLRQIDEVLAYYKQRKLVLTLRQLYYQLVSANIVRNKQREYKNLGNLLSRARLAGLVDWEAIEDRVRQPERASHWDDIPDLVDSALRAFRLDRWKDQDRYVELWCEKDALTSVLEPITHDLHVTLMVNRGYSSQSAMFESARRFAAQLQENKDCVLLYLGDFDPSGQDMVRDIRDRMAMFGCGEIIVEKVALNPDQVRRYKLPPNPAKTTDSRAAKFMDEFGGNSYEVDAIRPDDLHTLVRGSIEDLMDMDAYEAWKAEEERLKKKLRTVAKKTNWKK